MRASCCLISSCSSMTRIRWPPLSPLRCCSFLLVLVLVAAELEYYPDFASGGSSEAVDVQQQQQQQQAARLERLVRLLERRSQHYYEQQQQRQQEPPQEYEEPEDDDEEDEEHARQLWSSRLLEQTLAMERAKLQRERAEQRLMREQGEVLERPELLERPEVIDLLQQAAQQQRERQWDRMQKQRLLQEYQARLQRQQQLRLQELDYPELKGGVEPPRPRPEFTYSFQPEQQQPDKPRPFAVKPDDPRFYSDREWNRKQQPQQQQQQQEQEVEREEEAFISTTTTAASHRVAASAIRDAAVMKVEQRRASLNDVGPNIASELQVISLRQKLSQEDVYVIALVAGCSAALMFVLVLASLFWCRLQRVSKAAKDVDYPAYGVTGPNKDLSPSAATDQRLCQSAQMYHFQHQKQQIIAMEKSHASSREPGSVSEAESDEENDEGDYTVYECPGLAPTGEMEVKNPLFHDEPTPQTPAKSKHDYTTDEDDL